VRGRKPVPTALKVLRGNPGKRPINRDEPAPPPLDRRVPADLGDDDEAKREWRRTISPAIGTGQITSADRVVALAHCLLWSTWRAQLADAALHPHSANPSRLSANKTFALLVRVDAELGLTPSARSRVKVTAREQADPADAFFTRRA
jgi:phage terminase small subunit